MEEIMDDIRDIFSKIYHVFCAIIERCWLVLLACVWMGIAPELYKLILDKATVWLVGVYGLFDNNLQLNIPICVALIYLYARGMKRVVSYRHISISWFFAVAFVYIVLFYESPFMYATIAWGIDYRHFLSVLLGFAAFLMVVRIIMLIQGESRYIDAIIHLRRIRAYSDKWKKTPRFSPDYNANIQPPASVKAYAETIVDRLFSTELKNEAFAIGITSEWGAGKTTFLNLLKEEIQAGVSDDIVDFNPWMCQSPEQVTKDFFATLRDKLSEKHPELSTPIKQYAKHLGAISLPVLGIASVTLNNFVAEKNLMEMKAELSKKFMERGCKIVVVIDDLDRLDSSEVFEVLRLIRNTANLSNMIYLVAYDKDYITKILENQHISNPAAYLEKIFQLEIQLPKVTNSQVWTTLLDELIYQLPTGKEIVFTDDQQDLIVEILGTYRRAKRFARLFSLSFDYLNGEGAMHKLVLKEKFMLDLLQMDDKEIYDILWDRPEQILWEENGLWVYRGTEYIKAGLRIKPTTDKILACLWPENESEPDDYSIRRTEYSIEYFTLKVQFSENDVKQMLDSTDVEALVKEWKEQGKSLHIVENETKAYCLTNRNRLTEPQKKNLFWGVLSIFYYYDYHEFYYNIDYIRGFPDEGKIIREWFDKKLDGGECEYTRLAIVVYSLSYHKIINDLSKSDLIGRILRHFVDNNKECTILDIVRKHNGQRSELLDLFWSFGTRDRNIAFECLIDIFSKREPKPTMEEYEAAKKEILSNEINNALKDLFEDDWKSCLIEILQKCIEPAEKIEIPPKAQKKSRRATKRGVVHQKESKAPRVGGN